MRWMRYVLGFVLALSILAASLVAQERPTITFVNQSGENCVVKLVGPSGGYVDVQSGAQNTIAVGGGNYYILTRYGEPGRFRFTRGAPFYVTETPYSVSRISITLHKVVDGNYETKPDSGRDF
jgi:hypothetical protein